MATRMSDSADLAAECADAGLPVEETGDGWKVDLPSGKVHTIHRTYSDMRSLKNARATLLRNGLREAAKLATSTAAARRRDAARALKEAEARALAEAEERAAQNKAMRVRAAGPYITEPEDVPYEWFAKAHPAPWMRAVWMTPALAQKILDNHNVDNRPLNDERETFYMNVMLSGQWHMVHQGGAQDTRGYVQDSQHRLRALVAAGEVDPDIRIPMIWWVGMPIENFAAIDEGLLRTAAQLFAKGKEKYGSTLQAMGRLITAYKAPDGNIRRQFRIRMSNQDVLRLFQQTPDLMRQCAFRAHQNQSNRKSNKLRVTPTILATAMFLITDANGEDNPYVDLFFDGLTSGAKVGTRELLNEDDPRAVLREEFDSIATRRRHRRSSIDMVALILMTWNNTIMGRTPRRLIFAEDAQPPTPLICKPGEGATPRVLADEMEIRHAA